MGFIAKAFKPKAAKSSSSSTQQSTSSSLSENVNNPLLTEAYMPQVNQGVGANNFMSQLLGVTSGTGGQQGYNQYLQQAGYAPALRRLSQGIVGQGASAGLLNSGATANALLNRGAELNQGFFNNYLQQLSGLSGQGLQAGGLLANTGQRSTSQSQSTGTSTSSGTGAGPSTIETIGKGIGTVASIASLFSDRRLKKNIEKVGEYPDGLGIYDFEYIGSDERYQGVMADEVAKLRPHALGPIVNGFATVNYGAL